MTTTKEECIALLVPYLNRFLAVNTSVVNNAIMDIGVASYTDDIVEEALSLETIDCFCSWNYAAIWSGWYY